MPAFGQLDCSHFPPVVLARPTGSIYSCPQSDDSSATSGHDACRTAHCNWPPLELCRCHEPGGQNHSTILILLTNSPHIGACSSPGETPRGKQHLGLIWRPMLQIYPRKCTSCQFCQTQRIYSHSFGTPLYTVLHFGGDQECIAEVILLVFNIVVHCIPHISYYP